MKQINKNKKTSELTFHTFIGSFLGLTTFHFLCVWILHIFASLFICYFWCHKELILKVCLWQSVCGSTVYSIKEIGAKSIDLAKKRKQWVNLIYSSFYSFNDLMFSQFSKWQQTTLQNTQENKDKWSPRRRPLWLDSTSLDL